MAKPHRFRPGTRALMEIRKFQRRTDLLIKRMSFERFMRDTAQDYMAAPLFRPDAIGALQTATEDCLVKLFEDSNLICIREKRQMISVRYLQLARRFLGETN